MAKDKLKTKIGSLEMGRLIGKKDMVFCLIYSEECQVYKDYKWFDEHNKSEYKNIYTPRILMNFRAVDGKIGFPGGNVEEHHNTLEEALLDELREEVDLELTKEELSQLEPFITFKEAKRHISSFLLKVSNERLEEIQKKSFKARDFGSENGGVILAQITTSSIDGLLAHKFAGTALDELKLLIETKKLLIDDNMLLKAKNLAKNYFSNIKRENGNSYFEEHLQGTVDILKKFPVEYQVVMYLHDMLEDTDMTVAKLKEDFPEFIVKAVSLLTLNKNAKDMVKEVAKCTQMDLSYYCRWADRLNNMRTTSINYNTKEMCIKMVTKTENQYLPLFKDKMYDLLKNECDRVRNELNI